MQLVDDPLVPAIARAVESSDKTAANSNPVLFVQACVQNSYRFFSGKCLFAPSGDVQAKLLIVQYPLLGFTRVRAMPVLSRRSMSTAEFVDREIDGNGVVIFSKSYCP